MRGVPRERRAISMAPALGQRQPELFGAAGHDQFQLGRRVQHQAQRDAEAVAQGLGQQTGAGGGAHQGEWRQVDTHRARRRALADDEVQLEVLHRGIQHFLDGGLQAVDLVDEQHIARLQVGQDGGQVAGALDHRAGGGAEPHPQFASHDLGQGGLAQARRPVQQHVVHRLRPPPCGMDEDAQVFAAGLLPDELRQHLRPQRRFGGVLRHTRGGERVVAHAGVGAGVMIEWRLLSRAAVVMPSIDLPLPRAGEGAEMRPSGAAPARRGGPGRSAEC